ncbi:apolipoprotein C-IV [Takifugu flavidus]|uniref:Apolipoprotein C-IV n=1 Tax=Takifugu flavidus TaxID=433684 RepID=A0A5C6MF32_9TELE|nr:apolipoprotein C-IV [Takifugu flavidus]TWW53433.1 hypothetical protein D4764_0047310 [Takifugu flavidus]
MHFKDFIFALVILTQAWGTPALAPPAPTDPPGLLQRLAERAREASTTVQDVGGAVLGYLDHFYEDHIEPVKERYAEWASGIRGALWEKLQATFDLYTPKNATR